MLQGLVHDWETANLHSTRETRTTKGRAKLVSFHASRQESSCFCFSLSLSACFCLSVCQVLGEKKAKAKPS
jgi:hypothetical protein